ncbi:MAG: ABC transporter ATP-binding protein [Candidatus Aramenus sp.]|jgi:ABC-2 type transport system ATP-binding protein|nr:ABC transporter ATP-binding protein [Candidatus Aramenus sp.]
MLSVEVRDLWKVYKNKVEALKGVTFSVNQGEVFSLLGPNGAGKSTTIKVISCVLKPTKGTVNVLGHDVPGECNTVRGLIGIMPQEFQGFSDLTVEDNVSYFASLYNRRVDVEDVLERLDLIKYKNKKFKELSGGYKRRVAIACALAGDSKIVSLDEPTVGLDPRSRRSIWEIVKGLRESGTTVLLTTHYLDEAQMLSDRVAIIFDGKIVKTGTPEDIMREFKKESLEEAYLALMESLGEV